jgi:hypothetical protein
MKKTEPRSESPTITLYVVDVFPSGNEDVRVRTFEYQRVKTMLIAIETPTGTPDPPYGLRRIRAGDLPRIGGMFALAAVGETKAQAIEALIGRVGRDLHDLNERLRVLNANMEKLKRLRSTIVP